MAEDIRECAIGSQILGAFIAIVILVIGVLNEDVKIVLLQSVLVFLLYCILFWVLYGYLVFSRKMLKKNLNAFLLGTFLLTGGGWWLGHLIAFINVRIAEGAYKVLFGEINEDSWLNWNKPFRKLGK